MMDTLPRVPDVNGVVDEKLYSDLYTRTSWVDASIALDQIEKKKARGRRSALYMRSVFQSHLYSLGCSIQKHAGKVLFVAILVLSTFCVALKSASIHSKVHQLWIQEGGRLEEELKYTLKSLGEAGSATHQLVIQIPKDPNASVLHPQALLTHLEVLKQATSVQVQMFDTTWTLKDMCYTMNIPSFETHLAEQIFENIMPCAIITPLDCFWEGSKLLGPEYPVHIPKLPHNKLQWTNLNPQEVVKQIKQLNFQFPFDTIEHYMKRAGVTTGYTEKPCLDPKDKQCPKTAPNFNATQPDVGAELTGGCYGYAAKYMHWPETLVAGGVTRNRTGHLKKVKALQTVVQLMGEREMYELWNDNYKVHHVGWTPDKAAAVLNAWQKKFSAEVMKIMKSETITPYYEIFAFSSAALDGILEKYSNPNPISLAIGTAATVIYAAVTLLRYRDPVRGQSGVGIAGVLLISVSTAAGLGFCALLGIAFNAATTQVIPFLALGLGVDHIFLLTHEYSKRENNDNTGEILKKVGLSILFSSAATAGSFFVAVLIPVPALRVFCLQSAILLSFNLAAVLLVFPAMISLDLRRRRSGRIDILCCCLPPRQSHVESVAIECKHDLQKEVIVAYRERDCLDFSLSRFVERYYAPFLLKGSVKFIGMVLMILVLIFGLYGVMRIQDGLELTDLVPKNTDEYKFLNAQGKLFGFYTMFAVTQGDFEYPTNQKLLHEYHEAFVRVSHMSKNDNGGLPEFWLSMFRDWLIDLQKVFTKEFNEGRLTQERWYANASDDAILAYKLLVQTGHVDNPIDKSLVTQVQLVNKEGIINPKAFYNYLSAWAWNDIFAFGASQGNLRPDPREWVHVPSEYELKIPKSAPLTYTQLPFILHGLHDTPEIKTVIGQIREICEKFEKRGLPNYPSGIPFTFWEQYMDLRQNLIISIACAFGAAFVLVSLLLLSGWAALLVVGSVLSSLIQLVGMMIVLDIKLSAIPAVILVLSVGLGVCFTVHISLAFITSIGNKDRRVKLALQHALPPMVHGTLTSILAVCMLYTSPIEFIVRQFFWLLLSVLIIGSVNGLFFYPILLSLIGPEAEIMPLEHPDRISTPSPIPQYRPKKCNNMNNCKSIYVNNKKQYHRPSGSMCTSSSCSKPYHHHSSAGYNNNLSHQQQQQQYQKSVNTQMINNQNEPSLTTITEEPQSWQSSASSIASFDFHHHQHQQQQQQQPQQSQPVYRSHQQQAQYPYLKSNLSNQNHNKNLNCPPQQQPPQQHQMPQQHQQQQQLPNQNEANMAPELQSIVLQPEVTVETNGGNGPNTKVTANIKVELVTPGRAMRTYNMSS